MNVTPELLDWRQLYAAALFEDDRSKTTVRIAQAEAAMVSRAKVLTHTSNSDRRESVELDQSLRMLGLLKTCIATIGEKSQAA